jgi:hypothetical protein
MTSIVTLNTITYLKGLHELSICYEMVINNEPDYSKKVLDSFGNLPVVTILINFRILVLIFYFKMVCFSSMLFISVIMKNVKLISQLHVSIAMFR